MGKRGEGWVEGGFWGGGRGGGAYLPRKKGELPRRRRSPWLADFSCLILFGLGGGVMPVVGLCVHG